MVGDKAYAICWGPDRCKIRWHHIRSPSPCFISAHAAILPMLSGNNKEQSCYDEGDADGQTLCDSKSKQRRAQVYVQSTGDPASANRLNPPLLLLIKAATNPFLV